MAGIVSPLTFTLLLLNDLSEIVLIWKWESDCFRQRGLTIVVNLRTGSVCFSHHPRSIGPLRVLGNFDDLENLAFVFFEYV